MTTQDHKGKLFVIESGSDGSGKKTQTDKLYQRLKNEGFNVRKVDFPRYDNDSSILIRMYLRGDFGKDPNCVNGYTASTFYAVDRFASYVQEWKDFYENNGIVIADRYTTSNMVHQSGKFPKEDQENYLNWLHDLEFVKMGLPIPTDVILLDVPVDITKNLIANRANKMDGTNNKDIHEQDIEYLHTCYNTSLWLAKKYNWKKINCVYNGKMRSIEEIHEEIYNHIISYL